MTLKPSKAEIDARWQDAVRYARTPADAKALMRLAGWLVLRGYPGKSIRRAVFARLWASNVTNPYAYFRPGSEALESIVGRLAVKRAEEQQALFQAQDVAAGIARRSGGL